VERSGASQSRPPSSSLSSSKEEAASRERPGDASAEALALVASQLGYSPSNFVRVARWTTDGWPAVIESYPFRRDRKEEVAVPFPTLYWLTDRRVAAAVAVRGEIWYRAWARTHNYIL